MKIIFWLRIFFVILFAGLLLGGCSKKSSDPVQPAEIEEKLAEYMQYSKDGLTFDYPKNWTVQFEFGPGIYADKSVGIETPDLSVVRIMVFDDPRLNLDDISKKLDRGFALETSNKVSHLARSAAKVGSFNGVKASWIYKLLVPMKEQYELFQIGEDTSTVFVSFEFADGDISRYEREKLKMLESVKYERKN